MLNTLVGDIIISDLKCFPAPCCATLNQDLTPHIRINPHIWTSSHKQMLKNLMPYKPCRHPPDMPSALSNEKSPTPFAVSGPPPPFLWERWMEAGRETLSLCKYVLIYGVHNLQWHRGGRCGSFQLSKTYTLMKSFISDLLQLSHHGILTCVSAHTHTHTHIRWSTVWRS